MVKGLTTVFNKHRLLARAQVGGSATNGYKSIPPSLRFFAGGDQSVRGYDYQSLSPENSEGDRIGGRYMVAGSLEYQYSIAQKRSEEHTSELQSLMRISLAAFSLK